MRYKRITLLLTAALTLCVCALPAIAGEEAPIKITASQTANTDSTQTPESVQFNSVRKQILENNLTALSLQETVYMLENMDYEDMEEELRNQLNQIANAQWSMSQIGQNDSYAYTQLKQTYTALKTQFDTIKEGKLQKSNEGAMCQVKDVQQQIVLGGELLYVTLASLEIQESSLQRQLTAMNRTMEEMNLRYEMGQISALQLSQTKAARATLSSGLETLQMNLRNYKTQLEMILGIQQTGNLQLGPVPEVTQAQLSEMNMEQDLLDAKAKSYALYAAAKTLEDTKEAYTDTGNRYNYNEKNIEFLRAKHNWQAAQYTYKATIQEYELKFRTLYHQVLDYKQILDAAKVSLESKKLDFAAAELKYQQGTISQNAYLTAADNLKSAEESVQTAANNLFSSYNTYHWAVEHGILN